MLISKLHKVEGSIMLTIQPALLDVLQLNVGAKVGMAVDAGRLIVEAQSRPRYTLEQLLAQCGSHAEISSDDSELLNNKPVGGELI
ncbi:AbrB/MazE/SpoVT family DNA-binding domain-containing protein [Erwinia aphidicola]|uniref:AbrB/MazE/SpoVT family DNA-binding domain-containing protein n=1 Tax=Erwinia aphidicola TaxID=68334 RepID=UPI0020A1D861|nr:antitoxin [Erwinia aphidicola]MCP2230178.1 antitoxin ChpS [Erwinia aphidicola]